METIYKMVEHFRGVEAVEEHRGYFYSVGETLAIVILGSLCGLKNVNQIHHLSRRGLQALQLFCYQVCQAGNFSYVFVDLCG